jgi:ABC-type nitrate/sulfonate/bicarbonate transport system permease component
MLFGARLESKMAMAAVSGFFPLVVNTTIASAGVNRVFLKVARSVGASRLQIFTRVYFPSMLLPVAGGARLGIGVSLVAAILGELKVSNAGLGFIIMQSFNHFRIPEMYAGILLTFLFAAAVNVAMTLLLMRCRSFAHESAR